MAERGPSLILNRSSGKRSPLRPDPRRGIMLMRHATPLVRETMASKPKPKTKAAHEVEAYEASIIAAATHWTAFQIRGPHDRQKHEAPTREGAVEAARQMVTDYPGKPAMVYAVNAEGRQALAETVR